jgi:hypothetical protein
MGDDASTPAPQPAAKPAPVPDAGKASQAAKPAADAGKKVPDAGKKGGENRAEAKDPFGAERREAEEAYRNGILRTDGTMAFLRDTKIKKQHIGDVNIYTARPRKRKSGSVRKDYLVRLRARYVQVGGYEGMYEKLAERHLLVLSGQDGTGRFATALHLLDKLNQGRISRFDDDQDIESLTDADFEKEGRSYVVELTGDEAVGLTEAKLGKLRDLLGKRCHCVVLTDVDDFDENSLGGYAAAYDPPPTDDLLSRHIAEEVRADADAAMTVRLNELAATPRIKEVLGPAPRPAEVAEMARLLAEHGRKKLSLDEVETEANQLVQRQVVEWFSGLSGTRTEEALVRVLRLAAFRIALAVFSKSPYHIVAKAGVSLADAFLKMVPKPKEEGGLRTAQMSLFSDDQARRLPACRAEIVDGWLSFGDVRLPVGLAKYTDDRFPVVLLSYVWLHHHNLRGAMVTWLQELSKDPRPTIWVRAAQATGLFCSLDFHFTFTETIWPAADAVGKDAEQRRLFAAVALDQAARDERMTEAIGYRLKYWRRVGTDAEKWTTSATLGYDLGRREIKATLQELRVLGTPAELQGALDDDEATELVRISARSMANLLAFGEADPILRQLVAWTRGSQRSSVRVLTWWAMLYLIILRGFDLNTLRISAGREERSLPGDRESWPLLLALQDAEPRFAVPIAELLRWGLRGRRGNFVAKSLFGSWIRAAENDAECLCALVAFVPHLVEDETDARRLSYLITRLQEDWSDPLDEEAATALAAAIRKETP